VPPATRVAALWALRRAAGRGCARARAPPGAPGLAAAAPLGGTGTCTLPFLACLTVSDSVILTSYLFLFHLPTQTLRIIDHHVIVNRIPKISRSMNLSSYLGQSGYPLLRRVRRRQNRSDNRTVKATACQCRPVAAPWSRAAAHRFRSPAPCARDRHRLSLCPLPLRCRWARTALSRALGVPLRQSACN